MNQSYAKPLAVAPASFARARQHAEETERRLQSDELIGAEHGAVEAFVTERGREWARLLFEEHNELRAEREVRVAVVGADGAERTSARDSLRHLETVVGNVAVPRLAYQKPGHADLHPLDALLNLPCDLFSDGVRRLVAKESATSSFEEVVVRLRDYTGAEVAKRQVEELAVRAAQDFDPFYELRRLALEPTDELLVISTDGKGIVMRRADLRPETRQRAEQSAHKVETRLTPGEKRDRKRMAQVATVYTVAPWLRTAAAVLHTLRDEQTERKRPRPRNKRVWAGAKRSAREVIREAFDEAQRRDPHHQRRWVVLIDGDLKQLDAVKQEARRLSVKVTLIADLVHVLEYLWKAARALFGATCAEAEEWVGNRLLGLLTGRTGGDTARTIRWWANQRAAHLDAAGRKAIRRSCQYLASRQRAQLLHYAEALRDGLPISTGVIEGACRYLVKDRMDRTGARWSLAGAESVLRLRALRASGDFDAYWSFHLAREKERNHAMHYADGVIPDALPVRGRHLRRVK
jgi:hypothetical protein